MYAPTDYGGLFASATVGAAWGGAADQDRNIQGGKATQTTNGIRSCVHEHSRPGAVTQCPSRARVQHVYSPVGCFDTIFNRCTTAVLMHCANLPHWCCVAYHADILLLPYSGSPQGLARQLQGRRLACMASRRYACLLTERSAGLAPGRADTSFDNLDPRVYGFMVFVESDPAAPDTLRFTPNVAPLRSRYVLAAPIMTGRLQWSISCHALACRVACAATRRRWVVDRVCPCEQGIWRHKASQRYEGYTD